MDHKELETLKTIVEELSKKFEVNGREIVVIASKRTIRQYRSSNKNISIRGMRALERVMREIKRTHSQPKQMSS